MSDDLKEFTPEELAQYNGRDGKPIYVAVEGKFYDVSASRLWKKGVHMGRHHPGNDLTADIAAAPHGPTLLDRYLQVGVLVEEEAAGLPKVPAIVQMALDAFPFLQRHPHPMLVHFPIVTMILTAVFTFLYLTSDVAAFETTALHMLGLGVLVNIVGITSGFLTWWLNYGARMMALILIKIAGSFLMFGASLICFIWRILDPQVLQPPWDWNVLYILLAFSVFPIVSIVGYCGAELTFPTHGGRQH